MSQPPTPESSRTAFAPLQSVSLTREYFAQLLDDHVIRPWFPRCIDREYGGFLFGFDRRWRRTNPEEKLLECQARQTLLAAELSLVYPGNRDFADATRVGFTYLKDVLWDHSDGGWHWKVDRTGKPVSTQTKHLHGMAYAFQACIAVYRSTQDSAALDLAIKGFEWMDGNGHDDALGGYYQLLTRDGEPILDPANFSAPQDHLGTPVGLKDCNTQGDLLEALTYAVRYIGDPRIEARNNEMISIFVDHFAMPEQPAYFLRNLDWTPASALVRPMVLFQLVSRLIEARDLHSSPDSLANAALRLIGPALQLGWSPEYGGFLFGRDADRPVNDWERQDIQWWGSVEAFKALTLCRAIAPDYVPPLDREEIWLEFVKNFCDSRYGGFYSRSKSTLNLVDRISVTKRRQAILQKSDIWKDASHEGRALLLLSSTGLFKVR